MFPTRFIHSHSLSLPIFQFSNRYPIALIAYNSTFIISHVGKKVPFGKNKTWRAGKLKTFSSLVAAFSVIIFSVCFWPPFKFFHLFFMLFRKENEKNRQWLSPFIIFLVNIVMSRKNIAAEKSTTISAIFLFGPNKPARPEVPSAHFLYISTVFSLTITFFFSAGCAIYIYQQCQTVLVV